MCIGAKGSMCGRVKVGNGHMVLKLCSLIRKLRTSQFSGDEVVVEDGSQCLQLVRHFVETQGLLHRSWPCCAAELAQQRGRQYILPCTAHTGTRQAQSSGFAPDDLPLEPDAPVRRASTARLRQHGIDAHPSKAMRFQSMA
eukprot:1147349-Pelagomonas_calceolata.AAC.3